MGTVGIVSAMQEEVVAIFRKMKVTKTITIATIDFHVGEIGKQKVVLARSGVGQVKAAICTQILIDNFKIVYMISTGVAEALYPNINIGDIIISGDGMEGDKDFIGELIGIAKNVAEKVKGNPSVYVSRVTNNHPVYYAEIEGPAMGHTCFLNEIPFMMIRVISDKIDQVLGTNQDDFVYLTVRKISFMVEKIIKRD